MTFERVKPGSWATGEKLSSTQQNQLDLNVSRALDGYAGGTYTPSDPLIINGDGLQTSVAPATGNAVANKTYVDGKIVTPSRDASYGSENAIRAAIQSAQWASYGSLTCGTIGVSGFVSALKIDASAASAKQWGGSLKQSFFSASTVNTASLSATHPSQMAANRGGGVLAAVGDSSSSIAERVLTSSDNGATWAQQNLPVSYNGASRIAFIGTKFFVAQANGAIYSSTTGSTGSWSAATALPANTDYRHLAVRATSGSIWIGARIESASAYLLRTDDGGTTWSAVAVPGTSPTVYSVTWDALNSRFVAFGKASGVAAVWTSTDGTSWTAVSSVTTDASSTLTDFYCGVSASNVFVASANNGFLFTSTDLASWRRLIPPLPTGPLMMIEAYSNTLAFFDGSNNDVACCAF